MPSVKNKPVGNKPLKFEAFRDLPVSHFEDVDKKKILSSSKSIIKATCDFDYLAEQFTLTFKSDKVLFKPKSLQVNFRKQVIHSYTCNAGDKVFMAREAGSVVSFRKVPIDFFGFSQDRVFSIVFECTSNAKTFKFHYSITLPVIKQSELHFKAPGTTYPDPITRRICEQGFTMNESNTEDEINRCILLEEFKLMPIEERYKAYGYVEMLMRFLDIENSFELDLVKKFNLNNSLVLQQGAIHYRIDTPGQIPNAAASVCLTPMDAISSGLPTDELKKVQICAPIANYYPKFITIEVKRSGKMKHIEKGTRFHVEFRPNFFSSAMAQRSLRRIEKYNYENFLLNFTRASLPQKSHSPSQKVSKFTWLNKSVGSNHAQSLAIENIVNRSSFPSPYIVFGPPGTGKTSTLVEAVAQIVQTQPTARVLVTVNSNSACDEIGDRMLKFVGVNQMYRFYSPSFSKKMHRVHHKLKECSNLRYGYHIQPSVQELLSYNVIISTLINTGRMTSVGAHFDYIFVDECASSAEAFVSVPLSLAMHKEQGFKALLVLLGDPKQLGQIMRTYHNERYGFNISMMERAMALPMYNFDKGGYNPKFIVQLTDNFRSHKSILDFSNKQFYNSILQAKQSDQVANFAIGWKLLPNPKIPVMFHASWSKSEVDGTSQFNCGDIAIIKKYIGSLLREGINGKKVTVKDIGIISPYAAQRTRLKEVYPNGIEIGTVEYFQGREKLIIMVSGVRSKTPTIGFLKNEKRLNVAVTRAKALLIVIGNPETLGKNQFWRKFIRMCFDNKASIGNIPSWVLRKGASPPDSEEDDDDVIRLEEMMNGLDMEE